MTEADGWFKATREGDRLVFAAGGRWTIPSLAALDAPLHALSPGAVREVLMDLAALERLDTAGAVVLHRTSKKFAKDGIQVRLAGLRPEFENLLTQAEHADKAREPEAQHANPFLRFVAEVGEDVIDVAHQAASLLSFYGLLCITTVRSIRHPSRIRLVSIVSHMQRTGFDAMPIVGMLSFLIGVVITFQGADQLRKFGAEVFVVNLLGISILREMAILVTSIVVAGRSGSAFTAEIGTMKVNEEVDAMVTIGLDPMEILVLPRVYALMVTLPLLTFYADIMGLVGGCIMSMTTLNLSLAQFLSQLQAAVSITHFWIGLVKAPVFAFVIAMVGCYEGLNVARSAESVGRLTTRSVVKSIFLVIVLDAAFSILFSVLHI
ncbi:MAG TPA: MlaE family lipid ABC transporter permease subunit [Alphaproteobacteria bacterium]|nr:MlaE family lipid ABC transporter permease subunit [Alphaproteobacteria bacterium]